MATSRFYLLCQACQGAVPWTMVAQGDVSNFFQCLCFNPKVVAADQKSSRQGDFKPDINIVLGISADENPSLLSKGKLLPFPILEEIKQVKAGLHDCSVKTRFLRGKHSSTSNIYLEDATLTTIPPLLSFTTIQCERSYKVKMNATIRSPRTRSRVALKLSPVVVHRATISNDWELSRCTNKPPTAGEANNRKRTTSARSSSPPIAHWASQRPQKSSRTTRQTNLVPFVSSNPSEDTVSDICGNEIGSGFARCLSSSSAQQVKKKGDALSTLSETEEFGAADIKSKEKVKKSDEIDKKAVQNVQNVSTLVLPSRKNKLIRNFKLTNRRAYARQKHAAADLLVNSEDGHEELVAAVNALISSVHAFPKSFWRQMEPFLGFISDPHIAYLKEQEREDRLDAVTSSNDVLSPQLLLEARDNNVIPLCQRLIAALIPEKHSDNRSEELPFDVYGTAIFEMDGDLVSNGLSVNFQSIGHASLNGYRITGKPEHEDIEISSKFSRSLNKSFPDQPLPGMVCSEIQYKRMKINEKLLLEAQSIGIFLEPLTEDNEILEDIITLKDKLNEQVAKKKGLLSKLLNAASETRLVQEKEFEQQALDKLVTMAYEKYITCWGPNATGGKSASNKMLKQAAIAFVKRTLDRCHKFEDTGKSCFDEPMLRHMFLSGFFWQNETNKVGQPAVSNVKAERKSKLKPKQRKATQVSVSVNGLLGNMSEQPKPSSPSISKSSEINANNNSKEKDDFGQLDVLGDLQLPGQDLGSWLNIDDVDDGLQDLDFMGLQIPMDDLSDLNMMV